MKIITISLDGAEYSVKDIQELFPGKSNGRTREIVKKAIELGINTMEGFKLNIEKYSESKKTIFYQGKWWSYKDISEIKGIKEGSIHYRVTRHRENPKKYPIETVFAAKGERKVGTYPEDNITDERQKRLAAIPSPTKWERENMMG